MNRKWNSIGLVWILGGAMLLGSCSGLQRREPEKPRATSRVQRLLAKLSTEDRDESWKVCRKLLNTGPEGIREICGMLVPMGGGDDASARFALNGISSCVMQPKAKEKQRLLFARALIRALEEQSHREVQAYLLYHLRFVAKDESVEAAAKYLGDESLCEPAVAVLQTVATPAAIDVLTRALASAEGKNRVAMILALGDLRAAGSLPVFAADASSADQALRDAALFSAANIGSPASLDLFLNLSREQADSPLRRAELASLCLLHARRLAESGDTQSAIRGSRSVIENRQGLGEDSALASALSLLTELQGEDVLPDLLAVMDHPDGKARRVALDLANTIPGQKITQAWLVKMKSAAPEVRAEIVAMIGRRGDRVALPSLFDALNDEEEVVRMSAIEASAVLGGTEALPRLLAFLKTERPGEIRKTAEVLARLPGDETTVAIARCVASGFSRISRRSHRSSCPASSERLRGNDFSLYRRRQPSGSAVGHKGVGRSGGCSRSSPTDSGAPECGQRQRTNRRSKGGRRALPADPDAESQSVELLAALEKAKSSEHQAILMKTIAQIGTQKGLDAIVARTGDEDAAARDGAIRALADWADIRAATDMLQAARSAELPAHRILVLQGYIRVDGGADVPQNVKLEMYRKAASAAERPEEKRLVLSGLAGIKTVESLEVAGSFLDDVDLRNEAALTAGTIAMPQNENEAGLCGDAVETVLKRALESIDNADTRRQVQEYLAILQRPDEANLALGKPVKTSVRHQLDFTPEKAVDGDKRKYSHWDGASWPCWFQVDLTEAVRIESVHVLFYWDDTRYCQYTVEVSTDETHWTRVADRSQTREKSTFRGDLHVFEPIEARYVRIDILRNSANSAAHIVELSVYGEGRTPVRLFAPEFDEEGFKAIFNGRDLTGWTGNTEGYVAEEGKIVVHPELGGAICILRKSTPTLLSGSNSS